MTDRQSKRTWLENPRTAEGLEWYALSVASQRERAVFHELDDIGVVPFCPMMTRNVRVSPFSKRREERQFPKIPGYVFVGFQGPEDWWLVKDVDRVRGRVGFDGQPSVIPCAQIQSLMDREAAGEWRAPKTLDRKTARFLQVGDIVTASSLRLPAVGGESLEVVRVRGHKALLEGLGILGAQVIEVDMRRLDERRA